MMMYSFLKVTLFRKSFNLTCMHWFIADEANQFNSSSYAELVGPCAIWLGESILGTFRYILVNFIPIELKCCTYLTMCHHAKVLTKLQRKVPKIGSPTQMAQEPSIFVFYLLNWRNNWKLNESADQCTNTFNIQLIFFIYLKIRFYLSINPLIPKLMILI